MDAGLRLLPDAFSRTRGRDKSAEGKPRGISNEYRGGSRFPRLRLRLRLDWAGARLQSVDKCRNASKIGKKNPQRENPSEFVMSTGRIEIRTPARAFVHTRQGAANPKKSQEYHGRHTRGNGVFATTAAAGTKIDIGLAELPGPSLADFYLFSCI